MAAPPQRDSRRGSRVLTYAGLFKLRDWILLGPLAGLGLALGLWGFALCRDCGVTGFWPMLARSFALVRGAGTYTLGQHPWQLVVAQFMLPGLALFGGAKLLLVNLRRDLRVALARRQRNHTIVCGLGDTGNQTRIIVIGPLHRAIGSAERSQTLRRSPVAPKRGAYHRIAAQIGSARHPCS